MDGSSLTHSDPFVYSLPSTQRHPPPLHSTFSALSIPFPQLCPESSQYAIQLLAAGPEHPLSPPIQRGACMWIYSVCNHVLVICLWAGLQPSLSHHYMSLSYSTPGHYFSLFHSLFSTPLTLPMLLSFSPTPQISGALPEPHINS